MNHNAAQDFLNSKTKQELVDAYRDEYMEWKRTGELPDGLIRNIHNMLSNDGHPNVPMMYVDKMFNERLAELWYLDNTEVK